MLGITVVQVHHFGGGGGVKDRWNSNICVSRKRRCKPIRTTLSVSERRIHPYSKPPHTQYEYTSKTWAKLYKQVSPGSKLNLVRETKQQSQRLNTVLKYIYTRIYVCRIEFNDVR